MRTFIALELPAHLKESLSTLQEKLKTSGSDVRWVTPHNIHLTLKFLGEIEETKIDTIARIVEGMRAIQGPFEARLSSVGAFPRIQSPRVIWVGIDKGEKEICGIAETLEEKCAVQGFPREERTFSAHITLGRTKSSLHRDSLAKMITDLDQNLKKHPLECQISKIVFFKSILSVQGPTYEAIKEVTLTRI